MPRSSSKRASVQVRDTNADAKPYVSNYPPLEDWLEKIGAQGLMQEKFGTGMVETYTANGRVFIVVVYAGGNGWNVYTDGDTSKIDETLRDAEQRLKIDVCGQCDGAGNTATADPVLMTCSACAGSGRTSTCQHPYTAKGGRCTACGKDTAASEL